MYLDEKRDLIHIMSWKSRSQRFKGYFYEDDVWSPIFAKRVVWCPISAIFSLIEDHPNDHYSNSGHPFLKSNHKHR